MAVVSPWCYAVFALFVYLTDISPSKQNYKIFFWYTSSLGCVVIRVHVKSSWPLYIGIHLCYNRIHKALLQLTARIAGPIINIALKQKYKYSFFGLSSAIRGYEAGIMSNRGLACHGETQYFLQSTHRPSRWESCMNKKKLDALYY